MKGSEFAASLPVGRTPDELAAREVLILDAVTSGSARVDWTPVEIVSGSDRLVVEVINPAVMIGEDDDWFLPSSTARTQALIAEHLDAYLLTPHVADWVWRNAPRRLEPETNGSWQDQTMAHTKWMRFHSDAVLKQLGGSHQLCADPGKLWVITRKVLANPGLAANYGWHVYRAHDPPANAWANRVIQSVGHRHNDQHVDYSQTIRLMKSEALLNGEVIDLEEVAGDHARAHLVSHEGVLESLTPNGLKSAPDAPEPPKDEGDTHVPVTILKPVIVTPSPGWWEDPSHWRPLLERGMAGPDVGGWQRVLIADGHNLGPWADDDDFGGTTHNQTVSWQKARGLPGTGVVDAKTIAKIGTKPISRTEPGYIARLAGMSFKEATNYNRYVKRDLASLKWIVLHSMEAREASTTAENVASWFASGKGAPKASAHFNGDDDSIVQSVALNRIAWHAPGANRYGIGIEHAGYARQDEAQWADEFSARMLKRSARLSALILHERCPQIPVTYVDREGLKRGERGFTTHNEVSKAFKKSTHWDPGHHFPMTHYLTMVFEELERLQSAA